jgi:dolichol kinase
MNHSGDDSVSEISTDISFKGEVLRKLTHIGALGIPIIYYFAGKTVILSLVTAALCLSLTVDMIRFFGGPKSNRFVQRWFGIMIRPHEKRAFTGATFILSSSIIAILIFDKVIAILAIAYIVVGDTASAIVGRMWGRIKYRNKTLEGSLSFLASCCAVAIVVPGMDMGVKIVGALAATIAEAFTVFIDDNLTVPLISGAIMQLMIV